MAKKTSDPVYMHGLRIDDFMRLELVELAFDGPGLQIVSGLNGEGKSSLLRAVFSALSGKAALPDRPVRQGREKAEVSIDLGDKVVRLKVKPDRTTSLVIEGKDGARYGSPQKMLDEIVGSLAFDPLAFAEMDGKAQAEQLRKLAGLDFTALDEQHKALYQERTVVNRELARLEAQAQPAAAVPVVTEQEVVIGDLAIEHAAGVAANMRRDGAVRAHEDCCAAIADIEQNISDLMAALEKHKAMASELKEKAAAFPAVNVAEIAEKIAMAEGHNLRVRAAIREADEITAANRARRIKADEAMVKGRESSSLTNQMTAIIKAKEEAISGATFPVPGLSVEDDLVTLNGLPLSQASSAQQIRACLAIAAALNPTLRLLIVRQGNDLDAIRLREVAEWAKESGYQVLLERVASDRPMGIVIDAGRVAADFRDGRKAQANGAQASLEVDAEF